jgi:hypothetical protein
MLAAYLLHLSTAAQWLKPFRFHLDSLNVNPFWRGLTGTSTEASGRTTEAERHASTLLNGQASESPSKHLLLLAR